jgi:haloacetate dehalogenase
MFPGFQTFHAKLPEATLRVSMGGSGPPLMLLHGHPRTHTTWHRVAPILASRFTVVCPDLRGFGQSSQPEDSPLHIHSSKRAKARDCVALMQHLGFSCFAMAGHDRGAYTAFRCAMDYPDTITKLAILDAVPILEAFERTNLHFAFQWWHWFFFAVPEKPEQAIGADPLGWYRPDRLAMGDENFLDMVAAVQKPAVIHGMVEDYRAGATIDRVHDAEDRSAGRRVRCPTIVLWSTRDDLEELYGNVLDIWRPWCTDLQGFGIESGHHIAEEAPEPLAQALTDFFS